MSWYGGLGFTSRELVNLYSTVVTIRTTYFNSDIVCTQCFHAVCPYSINLLCCVVETWDVFCDVGTEYILSAWNSCFVLPRLASHADFLIIGPTLHLNSQVEIKVRGSAVSYIRLHKTGRTTSQYFTLPPKLLYLKDERALLGNIQGRTIFCLHVINMEYLTNAPPPHSPFCLQFLALWGAKYFATVSLGI